MEKQRNSCKAHTYQWQNQIGTDGCLDSRQVLIAQPCFLLFGPAGAAAGAGGDMQVVSCALRTSSQCPFSANQFTGSISSQEGGCMCLSLCAMGRELNSPT